MANADSVPRLEPANLDLDLESLFEATSTEAPFRFSSPAAGDGSRSQFWDVPEVSAAEPSPAMLTGKSPEEMIVSDLDLDLFLSQVMAPQDDSICPTALHWHSPQSLHEYRPYSSSSNRQPHPIGQDNCFRRSFKSGFDSTKRKIEDYVTLGIIILLVREIAPKQEWFSCVPQCGEQLRDLPSLVAHLVDCTHVDNAEHWFTNFSSQDLEGWSPLLSSQDLSVVAANDHGTVKLCFHPRCKCSKQTSTPWTRCPQKRKAAPLGETAWDVYKDQICKIYIQENKTLQHLRDYMKNTHGFDATERQYRSQLSRWNFHKRIKRDEINFILQERARSKQISSGQMRQFVKRRGEVTKLIPEEGIRRWEARIGYPALAQAAREACVSKPPNVECVIPDGETELD